MTDPNEFVKHFEEKTSGLKKNDPEKYLSLLRQLNAMLSDLNQSVEELERRVL